MLEKYENFFCDLSGFSGYNALNRDLSVSKVFLETLHDKLLFGTDNMEIGLLKLVLDLELDQDHVNAILYENANRIIVRQ
jgi:predicted TIM-barrel fold metal-dependent hydrolase